MSREFIIWGKSPLGDTETLLVSEAAGIASMEQAERVIAQLTDIGCTACRVQVFTLGDGAGVINAILNFIFALTGSRAVSELIGKRRMMARWNAAQAAHLNAGGYVVTIERKGEGVETRLM